MIKNYIRIVVAALMAVISLTGCYTEIDIPSDSEPVLCMNSIITAGSPFVVEISHTRDYVEDSSDEYRYLVKEAEVRLYVNGRYVETMYYDERTIPNTVDIRRGYFSEYVPEEGDEIRLEAESSVYGEAWAEVRVPFHTRIEDVKFLPDVRYLGSSGKGSVMCRFDVVCSVMISDNGSTTDFFRINNSLKLPEQVSSPSYEYCHTYLDGGMFDNTVEPAFSEHMGVLDVMFESGGWLFSVFSDRRFNGQTYPLKIRFRDCFMSSINPDGLEELYEVGMTFTLGTMSESLYKWYIYDWQTNDSFNGSLADIGLSQTFSGYSNVSTHAGVVGAVSNYDYYYDMSSLLREWMDDANNGITVDDVNK